MQKKYKKNLFCIYFIFMFVLLKNKHNETKF